MKLLKQLSELSSIPGREERVRTFIESQLKGVADSLSTDAMGNLVAIKKARAKPKNA